MFSRRSHFDVRPNRIALALARHAPRFDLSESNPTKTELPYPTREILAALDNPAARVYAPDPRGLLPAREAIAEHVGKLGVHVPPEQVLLTSGTSEAYAHLFKLLCDAGDEVLVPAPSYPLFEHLCQLESVVPVAYPLRYDGQWHFDLAEIARARSPRTRAILLVSPNNPTGSYTKQSELEAVAALGLPIVSDEVFAPYELRRDASRVLTALQASDTLVFSLHGLSKAAGLPQWKVSWMCVGGPAPLVRDALERLEIIADTFLSVATPTQLALPRILALSEATQRTIHERLTRNLIHLRASIGSRSPITVLDVEGGFYACLRLPETQSEEQWVLGLLEHESVYVQPGFFFDFERGAHVVASLLTPEASFDEGIVRLLRYVEGSV